MMLCQIPNFFTHLNKAYELPVSAVYWFGGNLPAQIYSAFSYRQVRMAGFCLGDAWLSIPTEAAGAGEYHVYFMIC